MKRVALSALALSIGVTIGTAHAAPTTTIDGHTFDLAQFTGASVTYRSPGSVSFDGKQWDQAAGVDLYTLGELAAGQHGSDPGDQVSLNDRSTPDWLQLNYDGSGQTVVAGGTEFVIYEISSSDSGVDTEGTSFRVSFNGGAWHNASTATSVTFLDNALLPSPPAENTNRIIYDLLDFGFSIGDELSTVRIENLDTGSGTSDPDFIFAGLTSGFNAGASGAVPLPGAAMAGLALLGLTAIHRRRRPRPFE